ncbi:MAG: DUF1559 domain-containing protein, partial [Planctomycetia bacterium]|nr:DUF1559 domain-containing protein [Planctomycetia bacterium]
HNYESAYGAFPMGSTYYLLNDPFGGKPCSRTFRHTAFNFVLPFLEAGVNFNAYNFSMGWNTFSNVTAARSQVKTYVCPSDMQATQSAPEYVQYTQCSYASSRGRNENIIFDWSLSAFPDPKQPYYQNCNSDPGDGMFGADSAVRMAGVIDGTSNTFLFGEKSRYIDEGSSPFNIGNVQAHFSDVAPWTGSRVTAGAFVIPKLNALPDKTGKIRNSCFAGLSLPPDWINVPICQKLGQWGFHSLHSGGANFVFADGSVKFVKDSIDLNTYRALGTRANGEVISADSL